MMRGAVGLAVASLAALALVLASPQGAEAKACGEIRLKGGGIWWVGGSGMSCQRMDYWAKSMLLGRGSPPGWDCSKRGKGFSRSGGCERGWNPTFGAPRYSWIYYPPD